MKIIAEFENISKDNSTTLGYAGGVENKTFKPIKLEDWQLRFIEDAKKKGLRGISMTINNNQVYISFYDKQ